MPFLFGPIVIMVVATTILAPILLKFAFKTPRSGKKSIHHDTDDDNIEKQRLKESGSSIKNKN